LPQKAELFQTVLRAGARLHCPEPFDSDTLGLNVNPPYPTPFAQLSKPEPKLENPSKNFIEAEAYLSFCSTHKKDLHIYNLILQRKLFFHPTSLLIYDIVNPPLIQFGRSSIFFHRYVLLVYFIPIVATRNIKVFT